MRDEERLRRIERFTDLPLLLLAIALIPLLLGPVFLDLSHDVETAFLTADWLIWAAFAADFGVKLTVAPQRQKYIRQHWLEAAMVVLPFLRPLRVARLLRFARVGATLGFNTQALRRLAMERGTRFVAASAVVVLVTGASLVLLAERDAEASNIRSFGDALWWAITTMTTVGYGDRYPTTEAGRGVAAALMLFGIAALSALTATIAAFLVREDESEVLRQLAELRREVRELRTGSEDRTDSAPTQE